MSFTTTRAVMHKELREMLRDRRSLVSGLFYGVWGPLVMALALVALARDRADEPLHVGAERTSSAPALVAFLEARGVALEPFTGTPRDALRARRLPVVLSISDDHARAMATSRPAEVVLAFDGAWTTSARQAARVRTMLSEYAQQVHDTRLMLRGVAPLSVRALRIVDRDHSTPAGRAATVLGTMPIFLLLSVFVGGMGAAADVMAGERERGSLEALLVHPVRRLSLVVGKWMAVCVVTLATMALALVVSRWVLGHPRVQAMDLPIGLGAADALAIAGTLLPLALAACAAQLLLALRAGSYKEAQIQLSYLMFAPMVPGFLFAFGTVEAESWMQVTPMLGQHLLVADILRGDVPGAGTRMALALTTMTVAGAALSACAWQLGRQSVLDRPAR